MERCRRVVPTVMHGPWPHAAGAPFTVVLIGHRLAAVASTHDKHGHSRAIQGPGRDAPEERALDATGRSGTDDEYIRLLFLDDPEYLGHRPAEPHPFLGPPPGPFEAAAPPD